MAYDTTDSDGVVLYEDNFYWKLALPAVALPLQGVVAALFLAAAIAHGAPSIIALLTAMVVGFIAWTAFEYLVHRWAFHQTGHPVLLWIYKNAHMPHHRARRMEDDNHRALHPAIAIPALLPHYAIGLWLGADLYVAATAGFAIGYCAYELIHYLFHGTDFPHRWSQVGWVQRRFRAHQVHHFANAQRNFGFTLLIWDHLFGTLDLDTSKVASRIAVDSAVPGELRVAR
jgi:dihydroceramide fatty acyl 2-hydroxylase